MINEKLKALSYKSTDGTDIIKLSDVQTLLTDYSCWVIGETRHPYVDVIHQWAEGCVMEVYDIWKKEWITLPFMFDAEYRIKDFTPEYEYLWMDLITPDSYGIPTKKYMTEKEASSYFHYSAIPTYFKVEKTQRVRTEHTTPSETK